MARSKAAMPETVWASLDERAAKPPEGHLVAEDIATQIQELIIREDLKEGSRIPSERELAQLLKTSRPTVSQAIRILVVRGLAESRRGSGCYVIRRPEISLAASVDLMLNLNVESVKHLAELRFMLESAGINIAIARAGPNDISAAGRALRKMRQSVGNTAAWMTADTQFHAALVRSSKNPYLVSIYESVHTALIDYEHRGWVERGEIPAWLEPDGPDSLMAVHEPILDAFERRDIAGAQIAVERHHEAMTQHLADAADPDD
ncbi:MAG: FadR family transcriptional regulator [Bifidobacteriaceae bacterium]|jgi:GntR family transcriptional repressor for pyruvate dehydrogenase complex|nr:FadR family transcriptional regulator [Bifidobacteriaceae bacterium]